jgi:poly [ADP-ribose] polymerase 6/8
VLSPQNKNFSLVNQILATSVFDATHSSALFPKLTTYILHSSFPSVQSMVQSRDFGDMKSRMDAAHPLAFPLLQWIISSNRSHIVRLMDDKVIKSMRTQHQYLLLSAPPEKEERFRELKAQHGSCFAFHGSSIENWHSIMRRGLVNASGTSLQVNGAAYGAGIYLSPNSGTSFGYSRIGYGYGNNANANNADNTAAGRFLASENMYCIAICEGTPLRNAMCRCQCWMTHHTRIRAFVVINHDIRKSGTIWVQPHEDHVVTRFFCVYSNQGVANEAMNCSTENSAFVEEITSAITFYSSRGLAEAE